MRLLLVACQSAAVCGLEPILSVPLLTALTTKPSMLPPRSMSSPPAESVAKLTAT